MSVTLQYNAIYSVPFIATTEMHTIPPYLPTYLLKLNYLFKPTYSNLITYLFHVAESFL
jgi:hypothetical protein